ncbi:hypothetical protein [Nostoc flagelliforme]|uniref:hypothetical protein n=1 Tax=Nostoc flagelliforme TaxID=1306274 RepID=UPI001CED06EC|nr:hypothetical protein [Nostoc flagelliforme]
MTSSINQQILLKSRPLGEPKESDFTLVETLIPELGEGEVLNRTIYLSLDPYMRGRMSDRESYAAPVELGSVMVGGTVRSGATFVILKYSDNFSLNALRVSGFCLSSRLYFAQR